MRRLIFAGTSRLTDLVPQFGARLLDNAIRPLAGSRGLSAIFARRNLMIMRRLKLFQRFLVVSDSHIGDAVLSQSAVTAIRDYFPEAVIDYVINRAAAAVIEGNPEITRVIPLFSSTPFPASDEMNVLRHIIRDGHYDLCVVLCPVMASAELADATQPLVSILSHAPIIVRNDGDPTQVNHFSFQQYHFVRELLGTVARPVRAAHFRGVRTSYSSEAISQASAFGLEARILPHSSVIMVNPDAASRYNMMPFESQSALLGRIVRGTAPETIILLGAGHTAAGIGQRLLDSLPVPLRGSIRIIPQDMRLGAYAALIDRADLFITGDTGPLHLAASRRYARSGTYPFRNTTAVLSLFGATMPRMSGYDSFQRGYIPSNQDAPSWCYQAGSPCRNITCLNKMLKTCRTVRCFEHVDVDGLAALAAGYIDERARLGATIGARQERVTDSAAYSKGDCGFGGWSPGLE
jgi:ADP-heptose:LPS heptosyltransferase